MAVGARDYIDQMLVKRYAKEHANNPEDATTLAISRERYWEIMRDVAQVHLSMVKATTFIKKTFDNTSINPAKSKA